MPVYCSREFCPAHRLGCNICYLFITPDGSTNQNIQSEHSTTQQNQTLETQNRKRTSKIHSSETLNNAIYMEASLFSITDLCNLGSKRTKVAWWESIISILELQLLFCKYLSINKNNLHSQYTRAQIHKHCLKMYPKIYLKMILSQK